MTPLFALHEAKSLSAARQSIVNQNGLILGGELLYRPSADDCYTGVDPDRATHAVIALVRRYGVQRIGQGKPIFINCTRQTLLDHSLDGLPSDQIIVEVLEGILPDQDVRQACRRLKAAGFGIALDDYLLGDEREPLVECADFIKADLRQTSATELVRLAQRFDGLPCRLLAEKVETVEDFALARNAGFELFQGYFFHRPERLTAPCPCWFATTPSDQTQRTRLCAFEEEEMV